MKRKSFLMMALLFMFGLSFYFVSGTYAKYTSTLSNVSATATVAKWDFKAGSTNYGTFTIDLPATVDATTLVADRIAPGTSGKFNIALDNSGSEVGVRYTISFSGATNVPSNLVFKKDSTSVSVANGVSITGTIPAGQSDTVQIDWEWPYETSGTLATEDGQDTTDGTAGKTMTVSASVTGVQVQPSGTAISKTWSFNS